MSKIFLYIIAIIFSVIVTFWLTSAYYRQQIRQHYIYVGDSTITELVDADPRKKLPDRNKNVAEYKKTLLAKVSKIISSRKNNGRVIF